MDGINVLLRRSELGLQDDSPPLPTPVTFRPSFHDQLEEAQSYLFEGLSKGARGPQVNRLQRILQRWNPGLGVSENGVVDSKTLVGLALYQAIYGQTSSDRVGPVSRSVSRSLAQMEDGSFWLKPPPKSPGQSVLYHASRQLGKAYELGGDGRASTDCGLLVRQAAQKQSPGLSRCADAQFFSASQNLDGLTLAGESGPGSLLFFRTPTHQSSAAFQGVTHVGLAISPEWMLAASSAAGKVVIQPRQQLAAYHHATANWLH